MNTNIQLKIKKLPKALAELAHSNQFLKMSAFSSYVLCGLLVTLSFYLSLKPSTVISLAPDGSIYEMSAMPKAEIEIERAVREYIKYRYNWTPKTVQKNLSQAQAFILPSTKNAYEKAIGGVIKFSTEKLVGQKAYPEDIKVDLKKGLAVISGDRITSIQGVKAAGDLRLQLSFDAGPRTIQNPWGVYIAKEVERRD